jgi:glycosidase
MTEAAQARIKEILNNLYGEQTAVSLTQRIEDRLRGFDRTLDRGEWAEKRYQLSQRDAILITYGDMIREKAASPLKTLASFCREYLEGVVSGIHILPFFPWSSDDGFSVINYTEVDPQLGSWEDVLRLSQDYRLMFDAVINHISVESSWFQGFLRNDPHTRDFFIVPDEGWDYSKVVRPRTSPLLTTFETVEGEKKVWTTFSADQADLNYHNPELLYEMIELLLFYVSHGARMIRLDAIAFIWKESGTACIHLPQVHQIVQLFRTLFEWAAPETLIITETNVPHKDNVAYFGDGTNEAHLVYNFPLPPLVLHTFHTGSCRVISDWAASLHLPSDQTTFFNFLASHDGVGLNPARGILSDEQIDALVALTRAHGGFINSKTNQDGTSSPYELNINFYDALNDPKGREPLELQVDRFICSQAIMLALVGVPGIYFHSLVGSRGWPDGVAIKGQNRAVNRQKLACSTLEGELNEPGSRRSLVYRAYARMLRVRAENPAFDPHGEQQVLDCGPGVFGLIRRARDASNHPVICLHNVTRKSQSVRLDRLMIDRHVEKRSFFRDLINGSEIAARSIKIELRPYQVVWLSKIEP